MLLTNDHGEPFIEKLTFEAYDKLPFPMPFSELSSKLFDISELFFVKLGKIELSSTIEEKFENMTDEQELELRTIYNDLLHLEHIEETECNERTIEILKRYDVDLSAEFSVVVRLEAELAEAKKVIQEALTSLQK